MGRTRNIFLILTILSILIPSSEAYASEGHHRRRSIAAWIVGKYIKQKQVNERIVFRYLNDTETDKSIYVIPNRLQFPRPVTSRIAAGMQVFEMDPDDSQVTVFYIHGGAYVKTFTTHHWRFLSKLARRTGCELIVPNYPLLPNNTAADAHPMMMELYRQIAATHDMSKVVIMGDSAGGGFSLALVQEAQEEGLPLPGRMVLLSPWVDVDGGNYNLDRKDAMIDLDCVKIYGQAWAGELGVTNPIVSPMFGNMKGLPEADIFAGTWEVLMDDCISVEQSLNAAGVSAHIHLGNKMGHVYPLYPIPEAKPAVTEIVNIVKSLDE